MPGAGGREKYVRFWTISAARRACCCSIASCLREVSFVSVSCSSSLTPRMLVKGLFSSWATPPIICAHGRQTLALHDLLLQLPFDRNIAHRNDDAADLRLRIDQLAAGGAHRSPASVPVPRPILRRGKDLSSGNNVVIQSGPVPANDPSISEIFFPSMFFRLDSPEDREPAS